MEQHKFFSCLQKDMKTLDMKSENTVRDEEEKTLPLRRRVCNDSCGCKIFNHPSLLSWGPGVYGRIDRYSFGIDSLKATSPNKEMMVRVIVARSQMCFVILWSLALRFSFPYRPCRFLFTPYLFSLCPLRLYLALCFPLPTLSGLTKAPQSDLT